VLSKKHLSFFSPLWRQEDSVKHLIKQEGCVGVNGEHWTARPPPGAEETGAIIMTMVVSTCISVDMKAAINGEK
jgi:hypothetical protein